MKKRYNLKVKLWKARNVLGLPEETYQFAEYVSKSAGVTLSPEGAYEQILNTMRNIRRRRFALTGDYCFPEYILTHTDQVIGKAGFIMQVIDEMTDDEFSGKVRKYFAEDGTISIPIKRIAVNGEEFVGDINPENCDINTFCAARTVARW